MLIKLNKNPKTVQKGFYTKRNTISLCTSIGFSSDQLFEFKKSQLI